MCRLLPKQILPGVLVLAGIALAIGVNADNAYLPELARPAVTIYNAKTASSGIAVGGWGSGKCTTSPTVTFDGAKALEITTTDLYGGGRIDLKTPINVTAQFGDPEAYLQLAVKFGAGSSNNQWDSIRRPGGRGVFGRPGMGRGMMGRPGMRPGMAGPGIGAPGMRPGMAGPGMMPGARPGMVGPGMPGPGVMGTGPMGPGMMGGPGMAPGMGAPGMRPGMAGPGMMPGARPGMGMPGAQGARPGATSRFSHNTSTNRPARAVRVMLELNSGEMLECQADLSLFKRSDDGWTYLSLPLSQFKGKLNLPSYEIKRVVISSDGSDALYVGSVATVDDLTPLRAIIVGGDKVVANFDKVTFEGSFTSGTTDAKCSWDFDNSDGIQEDATGPVVTHQFRKPGNYVVTLTVSDIYGIKPPASTSIKVKVN